MGAQQKAPWTSQSSRTVRADAEWLLKTTALHEFSSWTSKTAKFFMFFFCLSIACTQNGKSFMIWSQYNSTGVPPAYNSIYLKGCFNSLQCWKAAFLHRFQQVCAHLSVWWHGLFIRTSVQVFFSPLTWELKLNILNCGRWKHSVAHSGTSEVDTCVRKWLLFASLISRSCIDKSPRRLAAVDAWMGLDVWLHAQRW